MNSPKTYFTSDTHFGHENIITLCKRPFVSVADMNEGLIANWNAVVNPEDTVYHLGDFAFRCGTEETDRIMRRLNGTVYLLQGNHEEDVLSLPALPPRWTVLPPYHEVTIEKRQIVLCHYSIRGWNNMYKGAWHLFGHEHRRMPPLGKSCDIGVDAWRYKPVSFEAVKVFMESRSV